jgi:hypothetical protein
LKRFRNDGRIANHANTQGIFLDFDVDHISGIGHKFGHFPDTPLSPPVDGGTQEAFAPN